MKRLPPVHPGEILLEEFLAPLAISQHRLAKDISMPLRQISEIVHGKRAITADTALRLAKYFGNTKRFWLNLQTQYDLDVERDRLDEKSYGTRSASSSEHPAQSGQNSWGSSGSNR